MKRSTFVFLLGTVVALCNLQQAVAQYRESDSANSRLNRTPRGDNRKHPLGARQRRLKQQALVDKLKGLAPGRVHRVEGRAVELTAERTDRVFVILAEFGSQVHPSFGGLLGPVHNSIPQPNRATDNSTIWQRDYNQAHYQDMYFNRMNTYFQEQSSGRYAINGTVHDWVRVSYNQARYGANACGDIICSNTWDLLKDAMDVWVSGRLAAGWTPQQIQSYLKGYDVWDRYDFDNDGNFDEPDGYIDHFQIVHAGQGEETGGGPDGPNAIWSHRWFAYYTTRGQEGPEGNKFGGFQIGNSGIWAGDYTIQPENGGLGVFAHEYAHDLGLDDAYDRTGGDNSAGFWTLMAVGSYLGDGKEDIGDRPGDLNAWEKYQLGWLDYVVAERGSLLPVRLRSSESTARQPEGFFVELPLKTRYLTLARPPEGTRAWWSGSGNEPDNTMTRSVAVPSGNPRLEMLVWFDIERHWDYAYVQVSTDGGATFVNLAGNITTTDNPNGQNFGNGITGTSGNWTAASFDLTAYAGQTVQLRLRYWTDPFVAGAGFMADAIRLGIFTDGAENPPNGWTLDGFRPTTGVESSQHNQYYVGEFRQYRKYDLGLLTGPYVFGFGPSLPNLVQHFPYEDGLLLHYWDTSMTDNDVSVHPGEGLILPIDAHPKPLLRVNQPWAARYQSYDSTFGLQPTNPLVLFSNAIPYAYPSQPAVPVFNDLLSYYSIAAPYASVFTPKTGASVRVLSQNTAAGTIDVLIHSPR